MSRISLLSTILLLTAGTPVLWGQSDLQPVIPVPHVLLQIEERSPEQMDAADRQLLAAQQSAIVSAATVSGYDLQQGSWTYEQAVCPSFPGTMLLRYSDASPAARASRFVAVLDRASGNVRISPIVRAGNSPFHSSYKNPNTFSIFNQLLAREGLRIEDPSLQDRGQWVRLALCYAELSGDHPTTLLTDTLYGEAFERNVNVPIERAEKDGSLTLEFSDVNDSKSTIQWNLNFDPHGKLVGVERQRRQMNSPVRQFKTNTELMPQTKPQTNAPQTNAK
ncbi:MAG TPA: hypothetical protein VM554_01485 [Acidisarcina sp.]|nr:hypothetical protein [Acidisarcina sp.]